MKSLQQESGYENTIGVLYKCKANQECIDAYSFNKNEQICIQVSTIQDGHKRKITRSLQSLPEVLTTMANRCIYLYINPLYNGDAYELYSGTAISNLTNWKLSIISKDCMSKFIAKYQFLKSVLNIIHTVPLFEVKNIAVYFLSVTTIILLVEVRH